jgi:hypothetical protein
MLGVTLLDLPPTRVVRDNPFFYKPSENVGLKGNSVWLDMVDVAAADQRRQFFGLEEYNRTHEDAARRCAEQVNGGGYARCSLHDVQRFRRSTQEGYRSDGVSHNGVCSCDFY